MSQQEPFSSPDVPPPIGPYSPAIVWNNLIFISGQGPIDPKTNKIVEGDITNQTWRVFSNLDLLITSVGSSRHNVLKCTVFLTNIEDFTRMNEVYMEYFKDCIYPARTTIQAAALPGGIQIEIDVIAFKNE